MTCDVEGRGTHDIFLGSFGVFCKDINLTLTRLKRAGRISKMMRNNVFTLDSKELCHIFIAKCLNSYRDDLPKNVVLKSQL